MRDLELQSVAGMVFPEPGDFELFAFRNREDRSHDRHARGPIDLNARHRVVRIGVLVGDSTDGSLQGSWFVPVFYASIFHGVILLQRHKNRKPRTKIAEGLCLTGLAFCPWSARIRLMPGQIFKTRPTHFVTLC